MNCTKRTQFAPKFVYLRSNIKKIFHTPPPSAPKAPRYNLAFPELFFRKQPLPWHTLDARLPGDHRVKVWWRSGQLTVRRSDLRKRLQTDGRTDDGRRAIALAHSWNELMNQKMKRRKTEKEMLPPPPGNFQKVLAPWKLFNEALPLEITEEVMPPPRNFSKRFCLWKFRKRLCPKKIGHFFQKALPFEIFEEHCPRIFFTEALPLENLLRSPTTDSLKVSNVFDSLQ